MTWSRRGTGYRKTSWAPSTTPAPSSSSSATASTGLATTVIEVMQHTLPVIINDELGTYDLIRESGGGLVVEGVDRKAIPSFWIR